MFTGDPICTIQYLQGLKTKIEIIFHGVLRTYPSGYGMFSVTAVVVVHSVWDVLFR